MRKIIWVVILFTSLTSYAQNVGIGTLNPEHKLDVVTRFDTTIQVKNVGNSGVAHHPGTRLGILNMLDGITAGSRTGMLTKISFPNLSGAMDQYVGNEIQFDGYCFPLGSGCDSSDIFGYKVDIPIFANDGTHYGVYSNVPRLSGYAGYFQGRGYFSRMVGIGAEPNGQQNFYVNVNSNPIAPIHRVARFNMESSSSATDVENLLVQTSGRSSDENFGGRFITIGYDGTTYGVSSLVSNSDGASYGIFSRNLSSQGVRYGVRSEVIGNAGASIYGVSSLVSGSTDPVAYTFGLHSIVESSASTIGTYGLYVSNQNVGSVHYAGYFNGRATIVNGVDANYTSGSGYLTLGTTSSTNIVFDNNEILARNNGASSVLHVQANGGDVLFCNDENGIVGIGINSPANLPAGYLLAVDGKGIFEELKVELSGSWPDYVFEEAYEMRSVDELKDYIQQEGHLPNIPSAVEVEENGLLLGDMQTKMMEKIEELTLYIIQQNEQMKRLQDQIDLLKQK